MSNATGAHTVEGTNHRPNSHDDLEHRGSGPADIGKETKPGFKTSEFLVWLLASALTLVAGVVVDSGDQVGEGAFGIFRAFQIFGWITAAYILSRGLAKIGIRHHDH